jgi:hypothetical protein
MMVLAPPVGFEPTTNWLTASAFKSCSKSAATTVLSYGGMFPVLLTSETSAIFKFAQQRSKMYSYLFSLTRSPASSASLMISQANDVLSILFRHRSNARERRRSAFY